MKTYLNNMKNNIEFINKRKEYHENRKQIKAEYDKLHRHSYVNIEKIHDIDKYEEVKATNGYIQSRCKYCGEWFFITIEQFTNRLSYINGNRKNESLFYCSEHCKSECSIYDQIKYQKGYNVNTSREVQPELRKLVLKRDNYTCQKCNTHKDDLDVGLHCHHIDPVANNPIESADMDNCITLCKTCHNLVHQKDGCGYGQLKC